MPHRHFGLLLRLQSPADLLRQRHRPMPPPGAADADGHVAALAVLELRQPVLQKTEHVADHALDRVVFLQPFTHRLVEPGHLAQALHPVGIRQDARVEDEIHVLRHAALEREGFEHDRHRLVLAAHAFPHLATQLVNVRIV